MNNPTRDCSIRMPIRSPLALAVLALASGCGASDDTDSGAPPQVHAEVPPSSETNSLGETLCSTLSLGVDESTGFEMATQEIYSFPLINARLAKYPELAEGIGIDSVSDCEGARTFMKLYYDFRDSHPEFVEVEGKTKQQQFEEFLSDPNNIAEAGIEGPEVEKIQNGTPSGNAPSVVMLVRKLTDTQYQYCSATRLAGPFFLTSAHCLPNPNSPNVKSYQIYIKRRRPLSSTVGWYGGSNGRWLQALAIPYPGFMGPEDADRDLALVYVHKDHHAFLKAEGDSWNANMVLATRTPAVGDPQRNYGWGPATETEPFKDRQLRETSQDFPIQFVDSYHYRILYEHVGNPITALCHGDSGSPSVRSLMLNGVFSSFTPGFSTECAPFPNLLRWTRVDEKLEWLKASYGALQRGQKKQFVCEFVPDFTDPVGAEGDLAYLNCYQEQQLP
jgi:hypothetical protein